MTTAKETVEAVDAESPLPALYVALSVQVCRDGAAEPERINAATRLSVALGFDDFEVERFEDNDAHFVPQSRRWGQPYAYTPLDRSLNAVSA